MMNFSRNQYIFLVLFILTCCSTVLYVDVILEFLAPSGVRSTPSDLPAGTIRTSVANRKTAHVSKKHKTKPDKLLQPSSSTGLTASMRAKIKERREKILGKLNVSKVGHFSDPYPEFPHRGPSENNLKSLSVKQRAIEQVTDPLSWSVKCTESVYLLILVVSMPSSYDRRKAIRTTWADSYIDDVDKLKQQSSFQKDVKVKPVNVVKVVFIVGQSKEQRDNEAVRNEASIYKDIVVGSLLENYQNLTMKTRLALKWAYYRCKSSYVIKTDDDVFINPVPLVEWLKSHPLEKIYTGWCNFGSAVVRDPHNKWYVPKSIYSKSTYPGYCLGGGYLMSEDVVGRVLDMSYGRDLFPMEDLYVGLMVDEMPDVPAKDARGHFNLLYNGQSGGCSMNDLFLAHQVFPSGQLSHIQKARKALVDC